MPEIAKKSLGQHWLNDEAALEAIITNADVSLDDIVLEIGPGLGSLTSKLVSRARKVIAVEKDESLATKLQKQAIPNLEVLSGDILQFNFADLPESYKVVANIPYYLTSNLIRVLSETANPPSVAVLLIQKEVAERVAARPGQMSILAVTAQFYWGISLGRVVEASLFEPPPKVDSQILVLKRRSGPLFDVDEKQFFQLVRAGFSQRRKTLVNALSGGLAISKDRARQLLEHAAIQPTARAQTLSLEQWYSLHQATISLDSQTE